MSQCYCEDCQKIDYCHSSQIDGLQSENARLREALKAIAVAEGRENYPQELWAALLMDKARGALLEVK
jgi:hypothetical protein